MDSSTYRHVMGQISKSCTIPHNYFPCHNLVSLETFLKVSKDNHHPDDPFCDPNEFPAGVPCYERFQYDVRMSSPLLCGSGTTDVASDLVKMKLSWERKLNSIKVSNRRRAAQCIRRLKLNEPVKLSKNLKKYLQCFHQDPEPSFEGNYNWLYSGGNLSSVVVDEDLFLVSANYDNKKSGFSVLKLNKSLNAIKYSIVCELKSQSPVLQVSSKRKQDDILVCVRQKNNVTLMRISDLNQSNFPEKLWRKKVKKGKLLTCVDLNERCEDVLVTDTNNDVHVFNVVTKGKTYSYANMETGTGDRWHEAVFGEMGIYLADRKYFYILDMRNENGEPNLLYSPLSVTNGCEELCSILKSDCDSNYFYLGTTHNFVQFDIRNKKTVQRWTHMMRDPPQFAGCVKIDDEDLIVLQSQKVEETVGITNEYSRNDEEAHFLSRSPPSVLPGIKESLKLARSNGLCLNPSIARRFDFAVTGVQCLKNPEGDVQLFVANSAGDIFLNRIRKKSRYGMTADEYKSQILNGMSVYENHLESFVSEKDDTKSRKGVDLKHVLEGLKSSEVRVRKYRKPDICWKYHEMYSPESLLMYKDILAGKILSVWGYQTLELDLDESAMSSTVKVEEWMKTFELKKCEHQTTLKSTSTSTPSPEIENVIPVTSDEPNGLGIGGQLPGSLFHC